jgi:hypothetical protein
MKTFLWQRLTGLAAFGAGLLIGCSDSPGPAAFNVAEEALTSENVITQDLTQLSNVGVPATPTYGVFSVGWNQFVGPAIQEAGTLGKAFAVVLTDTPQVGVRRSSVDVGSITLAYTGGSADLTKRTSPDGNVRYSTFDRGLRDPQSLPVNVPFIAGGQYIFDVSGSADFPAGSFAITAPASLIDITTSAGDSIDPSADLTVLWTGGDADGDVIVRVVPHMSQRQLRQPMGGGMGSRGGPGGMGPGRHQGPGPHMGGGPGVGPLPTNAIVKRVSNTGSVTFSATELQEMLGGSIAGEIMVHVAQVVEEVVVHDGKPYAVLLKNADRVVLRLP